jgi:hypothetical protein
LTKQGHCFNIRKIAVGKQKKFSPNNLGTFKGAAMRNCLCFIQNELGSMLCFLLILFFPYLCTQETKVVDRYTEQIIKKGLDFIAQHQYKEGYFGDDYERDGRFCVAITSFSCLALMASGSLPNEGPYGENISKGLEFILQCAERNRIGYITTQGDNSRMHGHCFATLFLAQVYGACPDPKLAERVRKQLKNAVSCILKSQTVDGGWGYFPGDDFHEGSITVCALQGLRSARDVGIHVPKTAIDHAVEYLKKSANADGGFKYRLGMDAGRKSFPLTAAGVSSLNATGEYEMKEITNGLKFMMDYLPPNGKKDLLYQTYYYYGHFYAAQAMYHAPSGYWEKWFPAVKKDLLNKQNNGKWGFGMENYFGTVYATANATLILQIPYGYLPLFQK